MSRGYHLPYKVSNPRSVRGAIKRGWTVLEPTKENLAATSWMNLTIWCNSRCSGHWGGSFAVRKFAFEKSSDAMMFKLKWG